MSKTEPVAASSDELTIKLTSEMREQLNYFAEDSEKSLEEIAREFLADELEAQYWLSRATFRRKYAYR